MIQYRYFKQNKHHSLPATDNIHDIIKGHSNKLNCWTHEANEVKDIKFSKIYVNNQIYGGINATYWS